MTRWRENPEIAIVPVEVVRPTRVEADDPTTPAVGRWYWVNGKNDEGEAERWLGCVVEIGSNYVEFKSPHDGEERVHFDDFFARCTHEPDHAAIIEREISGSRTRAKALMAKIVEITNRLSITAGRAIAAPVESTAMALHGDGDVVAYKKALVVML